jgi:hypothetical protein
MERCGLKVHPGNHIHTLKSVRKCEKMSPHTPKCTFTLGVGIPRESKIFKKWFEGSKLIGLKNSLYHWKNIFKLRCLKWFHMIHLSIYNTSYGRKKGQKSKCQFDSWLIKINSFSELHVFRWHATYSWKTLNKGYNFSSYLASIRGLRKRLWASKMARVPILGISELLTWESWGKWCLNVAFVVNHKEYYKGEGGGFPKFRSWWVLWVHVCMWLVYAPKVLQLCTKQLVVWFVQVHMNNWPTCHLS